MAAEFPGPPPDFGVITNNLQSLATQISLCNNMVAIQEGNALTNLMLEMREEMRNGFREIRQDVGAIREEMQQMNQRFNQAEVARKASEANRIAAVMNSHNNGQPQDLILPFRSLRTNEPLENFPPTVAGLNAMNSNTLSSMLTELEQDAHGSTADRRKRLKQTLGIFVQAT